jgi:MSHA biogenesis protein MshO
MNALTARPHRRARPSARGFTLIEAAIVTALTGIVAAMVGVFIARPINAYVDQARRAELGDIADLALRRAQRELSRALPNSVRVDPSGLRLEFLPVSASGRYRAAPAANGSGDFLDLDDPLHASFDVLGPPVDVAAGDQLVIYNLGLPGADAYGGESRRPLSTPGAARANLGYSVGASQFPYPSPGNRFQIVGAPVTYACVNGVGGTGVLRRYTGYAIQGSQPIDVSAAPLAGLAGSNDSLFADKVESCSFTFSNGPSARIGIVTMRLTLASGGERLTLVNQAHVDNSP